MVQRDRKIKTRVQWGSIAAKQRARWRHQPRASSLRPHEATAALWWAEQKELFTFTGLQSAGVRTRAQLANSSSSMFGKLPQGYKQHLNKTVNSSLPHTKGTLWDLMWLFLFPLASHMQRRLISVVVVVYWLTHGLRKFRFLRFQEFSWQSKALNEQTLSQAVNTLKTT